MAYSSIAEVLFDYAKSEAKRTESGKINSLHLLAAIRQWNKSHFDELFPDQWLVIDYALAQIPREGATLDGANEETHELLNSVSNPGDVWSTADALMKSEKFTSAAESLHEKEINTGNLEEDPTTTTPDVVPAPDLLKTDINGALRDEIADALNQSWESVENRLLDDAKFLIHSMLGQSDEQTMADYMETTDLPTSAGPPPSARSALVTDLVAQGKTESVALARRLALAYISVASWAASVDQEITEEEVAKIDALRLELRKELATDSVLSRERYADFDQNFWNVVGLETVKRELRQRIDYFMVTQRRRARGLSTGNHSMHMAFLGNPGTGKTTIARLFAKVLHEMNLLETGNLVEVDRSGLVGEYIGHTEKKTNDVVDSALGGVLFIDEAYALADEGHFGKSYGDMAIDILIKRMEDDRDRLMVIVAGYAQPMQTFLDSNEGMKSRIPLQLTFPDYSTDELLEVSERFAKSDGFTMDQDCREKFKSAAENLRHNPKFGNARDIRNVYEMTVRNQFTRVAELGDLATTSELTTLAGDDVPAVEVPKSEAKKTIGFR